MNTKAVVLGTEGAGMVGSERDLLLAAVSKGLKERAGYVPGVDDSPLPVPIENRGQVIPLTDGRPMVTEALAKLCEGRAWLAGSAALWRYELSRLPLNDFSVGWSFNDYDLFAMSDDAYNELKAILGQIGVLRSDSQSNCVFDKVRYSDIEKDRILPESVNLVRPIPGQNWEHPSGVLSMFDLSVSAVVLGAGWFYVMSPNHIERKEITYQGHGRNPMRLLSRVLKYEQRGYHTDWFFWDAVLQDEKVADAARLVRDLEMIRRKDNGHFESLLAAATDAVETDEAEYDGGGSGDEDEYNDGWY